MQKHFLKFRKVFTNISFFSLILISNNSDLAAKYFPNEVKQSITPLDIDNINDGLFKGFDIKIKGENAIFVKNFLNFKKCFCIVILIKVNKNYLLN